MPPLAAGRLNRDADTRANMLTLSEAWSDPKAQVLHFLDFQVPVVNDGRGSLQLVFSSVDGSFEHAVELGVCYLGRLEEKPVFAIQNQSAAPTGIAGPVSAPAASWRAVLDVAMDLSADERELATIASALFRWHRAERYSPRDGSVTTPVPGGWGRVDAEGTEYFPRTDPAVIVLIEHNDRVLLGSNALWESGRFSLLAGFVEAGESLEHAVAREVREEAGVELDDIRYVTSQPWPFPRSLMMGFRARLAAGADPTHLVPDVTEISELRWFTRDEISDSTPGLSLPSHVSIARWLLEQWVNEESVADER